MLTETGQRFRQMQRQQQQQGIFQRELHLFQQEIYLHQQQQHLIQQELHLIQQELHLFQQELHLLQQQLLQQRHFQHQQWQNRLNQQQQAPAESITPPVAGERQQRAEEARQYTSLDHAYSRSFEQAATVTDDQERYASGTSSRSTRRNPAARDGGRDTCTERSMLDRHFVSGEGGDHTYSAARIAPKPIGK